MCVGGLLGMGGDSLPVRLCRNLLEVGFQLLLLAYMGGYLTICEECLPCPLSRSVSHCFSCSLMIGLIAWLCLVLFYKMDVEFKGQIFLL